MKKLIFCVFASLSCVSASPQGSPLYGEHQPISSLEQNPDVEKQANGNYADMNRQESFPLGAIQKAWDRASETSGVYKTIFHSGEIIKFRIREFMTTTIIFPRWEAISDVILGDPSSYDVKTVKPNVISVRSKDNIGVDSTITLIGKSGRVYSFYVRTEGYNSKNVSDMAVYVKVPYTGADPSKPLKLKDKADDYLEDAYFDPSKIDFSFSMAGDKSIAPERVYSDGIRTWFDFGKRIHRQNLPGIYKVEDGVDTPVNVSRDGNKIVAQAAGFFALKHGSKIICVFPTKENK